MWLSVVCTPIYNGMRHHSGKNIVDLRLRTTCNLFFTTISKSKEMFFFWEHDHDRHAKKEQALYITFSQSDWFSAQNERFWLVVTRDSYRKNSESIKATAKLNVYAIIYTTSTVQLLDFKSAVQYMKHFIYHFMFSYCKYSRRIVIILRQNVHIVICNGAAMEEAIWKGQSTGDWKKKGIAWHIDESSVVRTVLYYGKLANQISSNCCKNAIFLTRMKINEQCR